MNEETLAAFKTLLTPVKFEGNSMEKQRLDRCMPLYEAAKELGYNLYDFKEAICELKLSLPRIIWYADQKTKMIEL